MPRGGARPNSGPRKGAKFRKTIGRTLLAAPPHASPEVQLHALSEMRQASIILRNLMDEAHNAYKSGQLIDKAKLAAMEFLAKCVRDYIRAQKEIVPTRMPSWSISRSAAIPQTPCITCRNWTCPG
jgi:hypothetical protein